MAVLKAVATVLLLLSAEAVGGLGEGPIATPLTTRESAESINNRNTMHPKSNRSAKSTTPNDLQYEDHGGSVHAHSALGGAPAKPTTPPHGDDAGDVPPTPPPRLRRLRYLETHGDHLVPRRNPNALFRMPFYSSTPNLTSGTLALPSNPELVISPTPPAAEGQLQLRAAVRHAADNSRRPVSSYKYHSTKDIATYRHKPTTVHRTNSFKNLFGLTRGLSFSRKRPNRPYSTEVKVSDSNKALPPNAHPIKQHQPDTRKSLKTPYTIVTFAKLGMVHGSSKCPQEETVFDSQQVESFKESAGSMVLKVGEDAWRLSYNSCSVSDMGKMWQQKTYDVTDVVSGRLLGLLFRAAEEKGARCTYAPLSPAPPHSATRSTLTCMSPRTVGQILVCGRVEVPVEADDDDG